MIKLIGKHPKRNQKDGGRGLHNGAEAIETTLKVQQDISTGVYKVFTDTVDIY